MDKRALSKKELADHLGVSVRTVDHLVERADFPSFRIGRRVVIPVAALDRWLEDQVSIRLSARAEDGSRV